MSTCSGPDCNHSSHTEEKKLTDQVLEETKQPEAQTQPPVDNLVMAETMMAGLMQPFSDSLLKLGNNELRKILKLLVQFPFVDVKKFHLNKNQKVAFMFGERLIYANMVKRARAELDRTFGEAAKEASQEQVSETKEEEKNGEQV